MSLYVRLFTSFWSHRKTLRLRALLGDAAFWIPPRLWSYAAENQPDGDFTKYADTEVAMLLGYSGDAGAMLEALHGAGFMQERRLANWQDHNGYHSTYAARARKAAAARWSAPEEKGKDSERKGKERSQALLQASSKHSTSIKAPIYSEDFDAFWTAYPRKVGKGAAWKAWKAAKPPQDAVLAAVEAQRGSPQWMKDAGQFIPHPATWLNQRRWEDEVTAITEKEGF